MARRPKKGKPNYLAPAELVAELVRTARPAPDAQLPAGADPTLSRYRYCPLCNDGKTHKSTPVDDWLRHHLRSGHDLEHVNFEPLRSYNNAARFQGAACLRDSIGYPETPNHREQAWKYDRSRLPDMDVPEIAAWYRDRYGADGEMAAFEQSTRRWWVSAWMVDNEKTLAARFKYQAFPERGCFFIDASVLEILLALAQDHREMTGFIETANAWRAEISRG